MGLCVLIIKLVNPIVQDIIDFINSNYYEVRTPILEIILLLFVYDFIVTLNSLRDFKSLLKSLSGIKIKYDEEIAKLKASADPTRLKNEFRLKEEELFKKITKNQKRILNSFPNLKARKYNIIDEIKKWIKEFEN